MSAQLDRLSRRLQAIPKAVRDAVQPALDKSTDELVATMRHLAPVDEGELRDSIEKRPGDHELARKVVTDDYKARWAEFGTAKQSAQPFFWSTVRLNRKRFTSRIKRAIRKALRSNWGGSSGA